MLERLLGVLTPALQKQILKYVGLSLIIYAGIITALYILVDVGNLNKVYSYVIIYALAYLIDYLINLKYIFLVKNSLKVFIKYSLHILFFYFLNIYLYKVLLGYGVHYLIATWMLIFVLFPLRFLSYKFLVYREW